MRMATILPVLDVRNGQAVHAVGGRRAEYQPLVSVLTLCVAASMAGLGSVSGVLTGAVYLGLANIFIRNPATRLLISGGGVINQRRWVRRFHVKRMESPGPPRRQADFSYLGSSRSATDVA